MNNDFTRQLEGYRMTMLEITYHMPDYENILQIFLWQLLDIAPKFPEVKKFLNFWERELDGRIHSVRIGSSSVIKPGEFRIGNTFLTLPDRHILH